MTEWIVRLEDPNGTIATMTFSTGHDAARYAVGQIAQARVHGQWIEAVIYING